MNIKGLIILIVIGILLIVLLFVMLFFGGRRQPAQQDIPNADNLVVSSTPQNGADGILLDDTINIQFANQITGSNQIRLEFSPPLPNEEYRVISQFPNTNVIIDPAGLMAFGITYTVRVYYNSEMAGIFTFSTVKVPNTQTDPEIVQLGEEETLKNYPLAKVTPYNSTNVYADYFAPFKIRAALKRGTVVNAKGEIEEWMRKNGVDPKTHEITIAGE